MSKSADAFRTISEVAEVLETPAHVLRFWESRFPQVKPVKRAGGRRYYRPADVALLGGIKRLLHDDGMTIRGVQKILKEQGIRHVAGLYAEAVDLSEDEDLAETPSAAEMQAPLTGLEASPAPDAASHQVDANRPDAGLVGPPAQTALLPDRDLPSFGPARQPEPAPVPDFRAAPDLPVVEAAQQPETVPAQGHLLPDPDLPLVTVPQQPAAAPLQGQLLPDPEDLSPPPPRASRPRESRPPAAPTAWEQDSLFVDLQPQEAQPRLDSLATLASRLRARDPAALPRESQHALRAAADRLQALRDRLSAPARG